MAILEDLKGTVPTEKLMGIERCFEEIAEAAMYLSANVEALKLRMDNLESSSGTTRPATYAEAASARPSNYPPLERQTGHHKRQQKQRRRRRATHPKTASTPVTAEEQEATTHPPPIVSAAPIPRKKPATKFTVFVSATPGEQQEEAPTASVVRQKLMAAVNPARDGIRVRNMRQTTGGAVIVEVQSAEDLVKLTTHKGLQGKGLSVDPPTLKMPRLIVYDVPSDISAEDFTEAVWLQNPGVRDIPWNDFQATFVPRRQLAKGQNTCHWIVSVSALVRKRLRANQRIFALWSRCRVLDYVVATRCYRCQDYGHEAKHCSHTSDTCGHCVGQHLTKMCHRKDKSPTCAPCSRRKRPAGHDTMSKDRPTYKWAIRQELQKTSYD